MDDKELFSELGLSVNEGKLYSELVRHGKLSASEASSKAQVPYGKVYVVLQSLIDKGLVRVVPEKTKKFAPASPENLEKIIDEKKKVLDRAKKKVKELKQFYNKKEKDVLIIGEGDKGFWKIANDMIKVKKYGYSIKWNSKIKPGDLEWSRKWVIKNKNIDVRDLVRYDSETEKNVKKWLKTRPNARVFSNEGVAMSILDDEEVMIGLIKNNTTLLIRDSAFAKIMKKMFLAAYNEAEEIK